MGQTLLLHLLQREHCVTLSPWCCRMPASHGRTRHRANFGGALQGHRQLGLWQGPWQGRDPPRPNKALQDHLTSFSACTPLSLLARRSCTTRHAGCQDHHTLQEQGREEWLQQLQRHRPSQLHWQSLCKGHLDPTAVAGRTCLSSSPFANTRRSAENIRCPCISLSLTSQRRFILSAEMVSSRSSQRLAAPPPPPPPNCRAWLNPSKQTWKGQCSSAAAPPGPLTPTAASNKGAS